MPVMMPCVARLGAGVGMRGLPCGERLSERAISVRGDASHLVRSYDGGQREPSAEEQGPRDPDVLPGRRHRMLRVQYTKATA